MNSSSGYIQVLKSTGVQKSGYFGTEFIPNKFWITSLWFTAICCRSNYVKALERKREMTFKAAGCQCGNRPRVSHRQLTRVFYEIKQFRIVKCTERCATYMTGSSIGEKCQLCWEYRQYTPINLYVHHRVLLFASVSKNPSTYSIK
jgi:hypothetical protein